MVNESSIHKSGVYLVRAPRIVSVTLNRRLLVVFSIKYPKVAGVILYRPSADDSDLYVMLDILYQRIVDDLDLSPEEIAVKVFGMKIPSLRLMEGITHWVRRRRLRLTATDTGRNLYRVCRIDVAEGKVGVHYHDLSPHGPFQVTAEILPLRRVQLG